MTLLSKSFNSFVFSMVMVMYKLYIYNEKNKLSSGVEVESNSILELSLCQFDR